ncbi:MAG: hypothetical protein AABZ39_00725 [Spirochaetota bacterium]
MTIAPVRTEIEMVRGLAREYAEAAGDASLEERRQRWRDLHAFAMTRPPVQVMGNGFHETQMHTVAAEDPFLRGLEISLRYQLYQHSLGDDTVLKPYHLVHAVYADGGIPWGEGNTELWGVSLKVKSLAGGGRDFFHDVPLRSYADIAKLSLPDHAFDEEATNERVYRAQDAIGDIIPVVVSRAPFYRNFHGDICSDLIKLRGQEQVLLDMYDAPAWLHELLAFMRDGVLADQLSGEAAGDLHAYDAYCQGEPYGGGCIEPSASDAPVLRSDLWGFGASQEFTMVSPAMFDEFMLAYQIPILEKYGAVGYGCCEDLTAKIPLLRKIPNLKRIAVTPYANVAKCAEAIGNDYIISYRPNPTDMVSVGFDEDRIRRILRRDLLSLRDCHFDITLKDVSTVGNDPRRIPAWVRIAKEIIREMFE